MDEKGLSEEEVLGILEEARARDLKYRDGRILSSMCTAPHPVALKAHEMFFETNLGDAGLFPGTRELEREAVVMLGSLLGNPSAAGFIVSGGTEANLTALWAARNAAGKDKPEVILPDTAHFSFQKACDTLGLEAVRIPVREDRTVDTGLVEEAVGDNTAAIVGIAGSTEYGIVDDIPALSEIALENSVCLHVDAAFGGFVLPFLEELGYGSWPFDFSLPGVSSITVDPHKMGLSAIPSGGILFRDPGILERIETESPYLTEKRQHTLLGTRSGAAAAATFAVMKAMGRQGYRETVRHCMELTLKLYRGMEAMGIEVFYPTTNILVFDHRERDRIAGELSRRGWVVSRTRQGEVRLVIMPHVGKEDVERFLDDLEGVL
ncbi:MAG: tyrosine decarboxylase MfnA [Euryarchaeota archaeon]|nr:tyrosine decarboxylase MfnA [Euryarchaeota archaeon]